MRAGDARVVAMEVVGEDQLAELDRGTGRQHVVLRDEPPLELIVDRRCEIDLPRQTRRRDEACLRHQHLERRQIVRRNVLGLGRSDQAAPAEQRRMRIDPGVRQEQLRAADARRRSVGNRHVGVEASSGRVGSMSL